MAATHPIIAMKLTALMAKHTVSPNPATIMPASDGPTTREALKIAEERLVAQMEVLQSFKTFDALLEGVERTVLPIPGLNDVYAYDTATRIGAYLNIYPKHVYLYTSTRTGAKQLGIVTKKRLLLCTSLPAPFQELEPYEAEDALSNLKKLITEPTAPVSYFMQSRE